MRGQAGEILSFGFSGSEPVATILARFSGASLRTQPGKRFQRLMLYAFELRKGEVLPEHGY